jgi:hypothetical protein
LKDVLKLTFSRADAGGSDQDHPPELVGIGGRHLSRDPAAEGKAEHVNRGQLLLAH